MMVVGKEFIVLFSMILIVYCKIYLFEDIDFDYVFDEFVFDLLRFLVEVGDLCYYLVVFKLGEWI